MHAQSFAASSTLLSVVWMSTLDQQERATEKQRIRKSLSALGISDDHLRGLATLCDEDRKDIMADFHNGKVRPRLLYALKVLGRCECDDATIYRSQFDCIAKVLTAPSTLPFDTQVRLTKLWIESWSEEKDFEDIIKWASACQKDIPKQGKWEAILKKRITKAIWPSPLTHEPQIGRVRIQTISRGIDLLLEGERMGHCLRTPEQAYTRYLAAVDQTVQVFHLDLEKNPLICATLAIEQSPRGPWKIADFETVGRGKPPQLLRDAANEILEMINDQYGFQTESDWDEDEDEDDGIL